MATALDIADAEYPHENQGNTTKPVEGISLKPAFDGRTLARIQPIYFEHEGNRAVRDGQWKLVAKGVRGSWELYDMEADRTESKNLIGERPELAEKMITQYDAWAEHAGVVPFGSWKKNQSGREKKK
jgi:arylsulfatase